MTLLQIENCKLKIANLRRPATIAHSAFTIVELLVVVAILLALSSLAVGVFRAGSGSDRTRSAARIAQSALLGAKDRALHAKERRGVRFIRDLADPSLVTGFAYLAPVAPEQYGSQVAGGMGTIQILRPDANNDGQGTDATTPDAVLVAGTGVDWLSLDSNGFLSRPITRIRIPAGSGAWYALQRRHDGAARIFLRCGTTAGLAASLLVIVPTGDLQAKMVARHQPVALAAMEGRFESGGRAPITLIGQPNVAERRLDNPVEVPAILSFLAYGTFHADVAGLDAFPTNDWPDNIELLYYAFHVMAGLGTLMIALMALAALFDARGRLVRARPLLWAIALAFPMPYIATTAGWMTAELGRQPWLIYGLLRTADGTSPSVHAGTTLFTLIGFCGIDFVLGVIFLFLVGGAIARGPKRGGAVAAAGGAHG
jgi:type II secretory pathway pseudopilin PulG